jgi:hypothetical protein
MTISRITDYNNEMYRQLSINNLDKRHEALRIEERRVREDLKANEEARIEMNRRMNRPGQNVDRMA